MDQPNLEQQARLLAIWQRTVDKLKEVVREFEITQDELHAAGDYLNRLGTAGFSRSLMDVALAMTSVDVTGAKGGTRSNLEGPYHTVHPERPDGMMLDHEPAPDAPRMVMTGVVRDAATGAPLPGVTLDFWQTDSDGVYDRQGMHLRGIVKSDGQGRYRIDTVVPDDYAEHDHDPIGELFRAMGKTNVRAAHIHLKATVNGHVLLTTQMFMPTSSYLTRDYVEGAVSDDLMVELTPDPAAPGHFLGRFDISLAGVAEALADA